MPKPDARNRIKLQFLVTEEEFEEFERFRHNFYHSTSKQHLLYTLFLGWKNLVKKNNTPYYV
jgi:hypothetical protein